MLKTTSIRTFYILALTQFLSRIGTSMTSFAIGIKVFNDTGQVTPLALVGFFGIVPRILTFNVAGALTDRYDRRAVMALADSGAAIGTLLLLLSIATGVFQLWHLYLLSAVMSLFEVFQGPAFNASITTLVPDEQRDRANAVNMGTWAGAGLVAPLVAGGLFAIIGVTGVMAIDLLTFGVAVTVVLNVHIPRPVESEEGRESRGSLWFEMRSGFVALWRRRLLFYLILFGMMLNFFGFMAGITLTPYVLTLTGSEALLGTLMALMNAGMVTGAVVAMVWHPPIPRVIQVLGAILLIGVGMMALGVARSPLALGLAFPLLLMGHPLVASRMMSILQAKIPQDLQGRVMAVLSQLSLLATPPAYLLAGPLVDHVLEPAVGGPGWGAVAPLVGDQPGAGMGLLLVVNGLIVLISAIAMLAWRDMRCMDDLLPDPAPVATEAPLVETTA
ncbi:MAG: MFS transporter [Chloroflexi bacterium]|nr:MFS transporter [Chloroflexota bacterium]